MNKPDILNRFLTKKLNFKYIGGGGFNPSLSYKRGGIKVYLSNESEYIIISAEYLKRGTETRMEISFSIKNFKKATVLKKKVRREIEKIMAKVEAEGDY